jgi:antitoxin VapB
MAYVETYAADSGEGIPMSKERRVRLFRNGRNQAVRIPREFELSGEEAILRKEGTRLILEPAPSTSLLGVLAKLAPIDEDFPPIDDLELDPVDL